MHQDNMAVVTRLKHLSPTKEATKAHARMLNYLRYLVEEKHILPEYINTNLQPADPMTKPTTTLQGQQPYIEQLRVEYEKFRSQKRLFKHPKETIALTEILDEVVFMVLSSPMARDNYPRFPFRRWTFVSSLELLRLSIFHDKTVMNTATLSIFGWNDDRNPLRILLGTEEAAIDHASSSHVLFSPKATEEQEESLIQVALSPDDCLVIRRRACLCFYRSGEPGLLSYCIQRYREIHGVGNSLPQIVMIQCSKVQHPTSSCNDYTLYATNVL